MTHGIKEDEQGFSLVEGLLIIIALALVVFVGYYVWHTQHPTTSSAAPKATLSSVKKETSTPAQSQKFLTITEWGVRMPYSDADTLAYYIDQTGVTATITSAKLALIDSGCSAYGAGLISRFAPSDSTNVTGDGPTASEQATNDPSNWVHVGNYYYRFIHDQGACGDKVTADEQNAANAFTKAAFLKLEAVK